MYAPFLKRETHYWYHVHLSWAPFSFPPIPSSNIVPTTGKKEIVTGSSLPYLQSSGREQLVRDMICKLLLLVPTYERSSILLTIILFSFCVTSFGKARKDARKFQVSIFPISRYHSFETIDWPASLLYIRLSGFARRKCYILSNLPLCEFPLHFYGFARMNWSVVANLLPFCDSIWSVSGTGNTLW